MIIIISRFGLACCALIFLFSITAASDSGCRRKADKESVRPATTARSPAFLLAELRKNDLSGVRTLSAQAKVFAAGEDASMAANANLIWIRDSVLWLNVRKFGLEAVRALVTPDSVFVLNRLENTYSARGLNALQREYGLPGGFALLSNLVLGTAWLPTEDQWQADLHNGFHRLLSANQQFTADYLLEESSWHLRHASFLQKRDASAVSLDYEQFKKLAGAPAGFPYFRRIAATSPQGGSMRLEIELSDVQINVPKTYRFEIPAHYQRVD